MTKTRSPALLSLTDLNTNTLLLTAVSALAGWVLRDLRNRLTRTEDKLEAVIVAVFYLIVNDPKIPDDARTAIRQAMSHK